MDENAKFRTLLDQYRDTYLQFVTTGVQHYKDASKKLLDQITGSIDARRQHYEDEQKVLGSFLTKYKTSQEQLDALESTGKDKVEDIQRIQDEYAATQERYKQLEGSGEPVASSVDLQRGYEIVLRLGILLVVVVVFFLVGYFFPSETLGYFAQQQQAITNVAAATTAAVTAAMTPRPGAFGMAGTPMSPYVRTY